MRPIPRRLLADTATFSAPDASARWAGGFGEPVEWDRVRVELDVDSVGVRWADDARPSCVVYVDAANSRPAAPPALGSLAEVAGLTGTVTAVRPRCGLGGHPHHWEVDVR